MFFSSVLEGKYLLFSCRSFCQLKGIWNVGPTSRSKLTNFFQFCCVISICILIRAKLDLTEKFFFVINYRCRFFVDSANSKGVKLFCKVWVNLLILFQSGMAEFCPQIQVKTRKKVFATLWFLSQSGISDHVFTLSAKLPSEHYLPKNLGGQTYFAPFSVKLEGAPPPQKSTPVGPNIFCPLQCQTQGV